MDSSSIIGAIVDAGRLQIVSLLGTGGFASVYRAVELSTLNEFALKCLPRVAQDSSAFALQCAELDAHLRVHDHRQIVKLHRVFEHGQYVMLVLDYVPGGSLHKRLSRKNNIFLRDDDALKHVFGQILDAVAHCHSVGVYHRDLKPDNFLCSPGASSVYLIDFGLATRNAFTHQFRVGSWPYMSPECIRESVCLSECPAPQSDVWALGIILYGFLTAHHPWRRAVLTDANYTNFLRSPHSLFTGFNISEEAQDLVLDVLSPDPYSRISLSEFRDRLYRIDHFFSPPPDMTRTQQPPTIDHCSQQRSSSSAPVSASSHTPAVASQPGLHPQDLDAAARASELAARVAELALEDYTGQTLVYDALMQSSSRQHSVYPSPPAPTPELDPISGSWDSAVSVILETPELLHACLPSSKKGVLPEHLDNGPWKVAEQ